MMRTSDDANCGDASVTWHAIDEQGTSEASVRSPGTECDPEKVVLQRTILPPPLGIEEFPSESGPLSLPSSSQDRKRRAAALSSTDSDGSSGLDSATGRSDDATVSLPQSKVRMSYSAMKRVLMLFPNACVRWIWAEDTDKCVHVLLLSTSFFVGGKSPFAEGDQVLGGAD
jgi:hypothetical protein